MGNLQDFTIDQFAGATALIISSVGGLLMILWKSRCKELNCSICCGIWSQKCIRDVQEFHSDDEVSNHTNNRKASVYNPQHPKPKKKNSPSKKTPIVDTNSITYTITEPEPEP